MSPFDFKHIFIANPLTVIEPAEPDNTSPLNLLSVLNRCMPNLSTIRYSDDLDKTR